MGNTKYWWYHSTIRN